MTETRRCIVIPAIKKNAVIPDQLVKRLAGVTLIQRAIDTARGVVPAHDVVVVTDSQEISLICERNGVRVHYNAGLRFTSLDIITEMKSILRELGNDYGHIIIYRASCPLLTWVDIDDAYKTFLENEADCLVTVKSVRHRIWEVHQGRLESFMSEDESELVVESKALIIVKSDALDGGTIRHTGDGDQQLSGLVAVRTPSDATPRGVRGRGLSRYRHGARLPFAHAGPRNRQP